MELMEDICPIPEGSKRDEDEDLRIIAELNNPRIYKDVQHVLRQEQRVKLAITRNKALPFPCKCGQLCEFGNLLSILYNAFEKLYEMYEALHMDYTLIFRASSFVVNGKVVQVDSGFQSMGENLGSPVPVEMNLDDFASDVRLRQERRKALVDEDIWRKTYELHMECVRLNMLKVAKPEHERFMEWIGSHVWANAKCICYHCDYRDALLSYRHALLTLHMEYMSMYANYAALLHKRRVQESRQMTKTVVTSGIPSDIIQTVFFDG
ncbi:unnamed protein product [Dicrocoelium dendriticum]|nr:unnamed protein product [Dicrocoelium dendriticum]